MTEWKIPHEDLVPIKVLFFWGSDSPGIWSKETMPLTPGLLINPDENHYNHRHNQQNRRCTIIKEGLNEERLKAKVLSVKKWVNRKHEELWERCLYTSKITTSVRENKGTNQSVNLPWLWRPTQPTESKKGQGSQLLQWS